VGVVLLKGGKSKCFYLLIRQLSQIRKMIQIKTNHQFREIVYGYEIFENNKIRNEFDYLNDEEFIATDFICYRGNWYALNDFMCIEKNASFDFSGWDGYLSETFFSGVLIKISSDLDSVKIGSYYS
jgi:hypothetical protein